MRVAEVMRRDVVTAEPDDTFAEAAKLMRHHGVSALIVRSDARPAGIVTERDCVELMAHGGDPSSVRLGDRMSTDLITCGPATDISEAARLMSDHRIRHLPVVEGKKLVGIISIRDTVGRHPALVKLEEERHRSLQSRMADWITAFAGSMPFVYIHIVWFSLWIIFRVEKFPYGLLTMLVSLEAIFLSTFVMISQNRADRRRQVLADHQWQLVQEEELQNEQLIDMSNRILELTEAIHELTHATLGPGPAHDDTADLAGRSG